MIAVAWWAPLTAPAPHVKATTASTPRCFGAASHDPAAPCHNPRLRLMVRPSPQRAQAVPNGPCTVLSWRLGGNKVCEFGAPPSHARATVVIAGDSHTTHWRAGLDVAARQLGWRALQLAKQHCAFSMEQRPLTPPERRGCARWRAAVVRWLGAHPEVKTVFVSQLAGGSGFLPSGGRSAFESGVHGYQALFGRLPRSVTRIVVIRDNPESYRDTLTCVARAMRQRRPAAQRCPLRRSDVLPADPAAVAARRMHTSRAHVVDFTRFSCGPRVCLPVVGGALVHQDETHMTATFSATLGPYLRRAVERVVPGATEASPGP